MTQDTDHSTKQSTEECATRSSSGTMSSSSSSSSNQEEHRESGESTRAEETVTVTTVTTREEHSASGGGAKKEQAEKQHKDKEAAGKKCDAKKTTATTKDSRAQGQGQVKKVEVKKECAGDAKKEQQKREAGTAKSEDCSKASSKTSTSHSQTQTQVKKVDTKKDCDAGVKQEKPDLLVKPKQPVGVPEKKHSPVSLDQRDVKTTTTTTTTTKRASEHTSTTTQVVALLELFLRAKDLRALELFLAACASSDVDLDTAEVVRFVERARAGWTAEQRRLVEGFLVRLRDKGGKVSGGDSVVSGVSLEMLVKALVVEEQKRAGQQQQQSTQQVNLAVLLQLVEDSVLAQLLKATAGVSVFQLAHTGGGMSDTELVLLALRGAMQSGKGGTSILDRFVKLDHVCCCPNCERSFPLAPCAYPSTLEAQLRDALVGRNGGCLRRMLLAQGTKL
ncbi:hypothetical protein JCM10207_003606 [Rhodosporidiobolus poonsookiae]